MKFITIQLLVRALFTQPSIKMQVGIASVMGQFEKGGPGVPPVNHPQDCACDNQTDPLPCFRERTATPLRPFDLEICAPEKQMLDFSHSRRDDAIISARSNG